MDLQKYKNLLFQKIKKQISIWFETKEDVLIPNDEVYRFLHSMYGSSGTLQLVGLYQLSGKLMNQIKEDDKKLWDKEELRNFLDELISLSYEYENFQQLDDNEDFPREDNVPLIQIIEDDLSMLILIKEHFEERGWMVVGNNNPKKAIAQYIDLNPDCVLIDTQLSGINGFHLLEELQSQSNHHFVPKLMTSLLNDRETRMMAYQKGADDFIEKPLDLEELMVRVERLLKRKNQYDQSALLDDLTKLYNRKFLKDVFARSLNDLNRSGDEFSFAILDLDHFKKINDDYGHVTGDRVLMRFAEYLKENTRIMDTVIRYGGEEFIILLQKTSREEAVSILNRLLQKFTEVSFAREGSTFNVTFSAGVVSINDSSSVLEEAIKIADQALYKAKENGRAGVETITNEPVEIKKKPLYVSVIDDDAIIRTMLMRILKSMDTDRYELHLEVFDNGLTFFDSKRLEKTGQHFLILDGVMPVMDGVEILQKVRKMKKDTNLHILMLTGRKSESDIERALQLGADDYVTKPFSIKELQARIQRLVKRMK